MRVDPDNARRIIEALEEFGFGGLGLSVDDFLEDQVVVQLGREPQRIDLLTFASGVDFDEAFENRVLFDFGDTEVPVIGRADLRRNKLATGRQPNQPWVVGFSRARKATRHCGRVSPSMESRKV